MLMRTHWPLPPALAETGPRVLESDRRFSESLLWRLQREFFERTGAAAWSGSVVPQYVTSNPFIATAYADVVAAFLDESAVNPAQPLYIVELGAGSGRFAHHFLRRLGPRPGVKYVMTDFAERNLAAWEAHPDLRRWRESGHLLLGRFDAESSDAIELAGGARLSRVANPLVVIANYFFDGIPHDVFHVQDGALSECRVTVTSRSGRAELGDVRLDWRKEAAGPAPYGDADLDGILDEYRTQLRGSVICFPRAGLRCCEALARMAAGGLLLLSADKGHVDLGELEGLAPPAPVHHGSFSLSVNYHALGRWFQRRGGRMLHAGRAHHLAVVALLLGAGGAATARAFEERIAGFGPDDFFTLKRSLEPCFEKLDVRGVLALTRLAGDDPRIFSQCLPALLRGLPQADAAEREALHGTIGRVWERYFHIGDDDLAFKLGVLLAEMRCFEEAAELFQRSLELFGDDASTLFNLAACRVHLRQNDAARALAGRALATDPCHGGARALLLSLA